MANLGELETLGSDGLGVGLAVATMLFPASAPIFAIIKVAVPALLAAAPFALQAIQDGEQALQAAEKASPGLTDLLAGLIAKAGAATTPSAVVSALYAQNLRDSGYDPRG